MGTRYFRFPFSASGDEIEDNGDASIEDLNLL